MNELTAAEVDLLLRLRRSFAVAPETFVVVGGWAARLLRFHPLARELPFEPLFTEDLDIAAPSDVRDPSTRVGDQLKHEGFVADFLTDDRPPLTLYSLGDFDLEFIAPWVPRRSGNTSTLAVLGAVAQTAKHVEVLLIEPCEIEVPKVGSLRVASPAAYLIQKTLTFSNRRGPDKKGKDVLYLWEVISLFSRATRLKPDVIEGAHHVRARLSKAQLQQLAAARSGLADPGHAAVREASRQALLSGRTASPQAIALAVSSALAELLG